MSQFHTVPIVTIIRLCFMSASLNDAFLSRQPQIDPPTRGPTHGSVCRLHVGAEGNSRE